MKTAAPAVTTIAPRPPAAPAALFADSGSGPGGEGSGAGSGVSTQPYRPCTLPCRRQRRRRSSRDCKGQLMRYLREVGAQSMAV
eukprot:COSAG06_NODE_6969_length_2692_cov_2.853066_2_plen_84_part_00